MKNMINTEIIYGYMAANKLSKKTFCQFAKISIGSLNKVLHNKENIRIVTLFKIAHIMKVGIDKLLL